MLEFCANEWSETRSDHQTLNIWKNKILIAGVCTGSANLKK